MSGKHWISHISESGVELIKKLDSSRSEKDMLSAEVQQKLSDEDDQQSMHSENKVGEIRLAEATATAALCDYTWSNEGRLGLVIEPLDSHGDKEAPSGVYVAEVKNPSLAIQPGWRIVRVAGNEAAQLSHNQILGLIKSSPRPLTIVFDMGESNAHPEIKHSSNDQSNIEDAEAQLESIALVQWSMNTILLIVCCIGRCLHRLMRPCVLRLKNVKC